jgi:hypothetical protein
MPDALNNAMVNSDVSPATGEVSHTFDDDCIRWHLSMIESGKAIFEIRGEASGTGFSFPAVAAVYRDMGVGRGWGGMTIYIQSGGSPTIHIMEEIGDIRDVSN